MRPDPSDRALKSDLTERKTLWTPGMPTPGNGQHWRHEGGSYYVDVTKDYVPVAEVERLLREVDRNFAGAHVNAGVAIGAVRRALREALNGDDT